MLERGSTGYTVAIVIGLVAFMATLGGFALTLDRCARTGRAVPSTASIDGRDVLSISGGIDGAMVAAVDRALATATGKVTRVRVDSFGGLTDEAARLGRTLTALDAPIEVPAGATCQSACVGLLAYAPERVTIAPTATVMFHEEATRFGLANDGPCGAVNWATVRLSEFVSWVAHSLGDERPPVMLAWATRVSDKLPALFAMCRTNPLRTQAGMMLTGAELDGLRDGSIPASALTARCPAS